MPLIAVLAALLASAAPDSSVLTLDEVVVIADRVPHQVQDVSASVSVVTAEELERSLARTVTAALEALPGVFVRRTGQFGRTDIDIRGIGDRGCRVAVLVDGRPEKMSLYGCTVTHTLPMSTVERIEVVRGPQSVLYGSDAMAGVVNIITRRAALPLEYSVDADYGSFNTIHSNLSVGTRQREFHALLTADKAMSDGHLPNSQYNGNDLSLRAGLELSPALQLDLTGKYFTGVKHEPKRYTDPETVAPTTWNQYDRGGMDLTATLGTNEFGGFAKLFRIFGEHEFDPDDGWHSTDFTNGITLHGHRRFAIRNLVQAGLEFAQLGATWIQPDFSPSWTRVQAAFFVQDEQSLGPVTLNAGTRLHLDELSGPAFCPKAGIVFRPFSGSALRASVNRGFRFPSLNYTSVLPAMNPDLVPEVSWNYEVGLRQRVLSWLEADLAGFILVGENLIETGPNPEPPPPVRFQNLGKFVFRGIEAMVNARTGILRSKLAWSLLDPGVHTRARPGSKLNAGLGIDISGFCADLNAEQVALYFAADSSAQPIPDRATFDLRAGYQVFTWLQVWAAVENLLDADYLAFADLPGTQAGLYQMPGRTFSLGLRFSQPTVQKKPGL